MRGLLEITFLLTSIVGIWRPFIRHHCGDVLIVQWFKIILKSTYVYTN